METSAPQPAPAEPANLIDQIHFAQRSKQKLKADSLSASAPLYVLGFVGLAFMVIVHGLSRAFSVGPIPGIAQLAGLAMVVGAALVGGLLRARRIAQFKRRTRGMAADVDDQRRLRCIGAPALLLDEGPLQDVPFEPETFRLYFRWPTCPESQALLGTLIVLGIVGAVWLGGIVTGDWGRGMVLQLWAGLLVGSTLTMVLCPTLVRVAPGRVELLHYPLFSRPRIKRVDLRTAWLLADLRNWVVRIEEPGREKSLDLTISLVPQRRRLAYFLFLAALSTYEPPEIAGDDLTG